MRDNKMEKNVDPKTNSTATTDETKNFSPLVMSAGKVTELSAVASSPTHNIWEEIKNLDLNLYSLPNQKVHMHCKVIPLNEKELYLTSGVAGFLPALENAISSSYIVEKQDKYIIVKHAESKSESYVSEKPAIFIQGK